MDVKKDNFQLFFEYRALAGIDAENLRYSDGIFNNGSDLVDTDDLPHDHIELARSMGLCNGFRIWCNSTPENINHAMQDGFSAHIDIFRMHEWRRIAARRGVALRSFTDAMIDHIREMVLKHGDKIFVNFCAEYDNEPWSQVPPSSDRTGAFASLVEYYTTNPLIASFPAADSPDGSKMITAREYMSERGIMPRELNMACLYCQLFSPHLLYKLGAQRVIAETLVGLNNQMVCAFLSGAARQYNGKWQCDVAVFDCHGAPALPMSYDRRRRRIAGFSESMMLRIWLATYLSGADAMLFQASSSGFFIRDPDGHLELTPIGEIGKEFADFTLRRHHDRGETHRPVALLMAEDHGYSAPYRGQSLVFWGKAPTDRAHRSVDAFFRIAFSGFHDIKGTGCFDYGKWTPSGSYDGQQSWMTPATKNLNEFGKRFRETIRDRGVDQRPLESAYLTASTWGDSFDVLTDNVSLDVLRQYPALILLGNIKIYENLRKRLLDYVEGGGKILLNAAQITPEDSAWLGVNISGEKGCRLHHTHSLLTGRQFAESRYEYLKTTLNTEAETLIQTDFIGVEGDPVLVRRKAGRGEIWFITIPDYLPNPEPVELSWVEACKEAVDEFIRPHLVLDVQGPPIEWIVNDTALSGARGKEPVKKAEERRVWVSLFNNSSEIWSGSVRVMEKLGRVSARDIWNEKPVSFEYDAGGYVRLFCELAPWDFRIMEIKNLAIGK